MMIAVVNGEYIDRHGRHGREEVARVGQDKQTNKQDPGQALGRNPRWELSRCCFPLDVLALCESHRAEKNCTLHVSTPG